MSYVLRSTDDISLFKSHGGGKAANMAKLSQHGFAVPPWFCVTTKAFDEFVASNKLEPKLKILPSSDLAAFAKNVESVFLASPIPESIEEQLFGEMNAMKLHEAFVAVRSSGLDEDSADNSFAGQFSSYLFQRGRKAVADSLRRCWASGFSERALSYRLERGLPVTDIRVGVVVQLMVDAESAGVAFSRDPIHQTQRERVLVSSVWGLGEGLVSGELDADHFVWKRGDGSLISTVVEKEHGFYQAELGGLIKTKLPEAKCKAPSLTEKQVIQVAALAHDLEMKLGSPQDCEWAFHQDKLYCLQTRPITNLPPNAFFDEKTGGGAAILWDNSNIIESYSGVTSPLTFSFASSAYRQVYIQFCEVMGVPAPMVQSHESMFRNMLGSIRGRIYYNLINWYRLVLMLPGAGNNKGFMETMMGVKQGLKPELTGLFDFMKNPPRYGLKIRLKVAAGTLWRFLTIDKIIGRFQRHFNKTYEEARKKDFSAMSLPELAGYHNELDAQILRRWQAPIINDYLCMIFFGLLKKWTGAWLVKEGEDGGSLQNDLLCGQGDLDSTEPTKMLMRIAEKIDSGEAARRDWFLAQDPSAVYSTLKNSGKYPEILAQIDEFLDRYGFRCVNELKLEEPDLHDDPSFVINAVASYVRMKSYSIGEMEERERAIRGKAESLVRERIKGPKLLIYFWVLKQARRAVRNRENLRFARTKIFGVVRHLFRAMGQKLTDIGVLSTAHDVFYLTVEELFAYVEGRPVTRDLGRLVAQRRAEYDEFRRTPPPPDRLITTGAAGAWNDYPQLLADSDLLQSERPVSDDPNLLLGVPCSPGVVEGTVRVVHELKDAMGLNGEILVTGRTDPGWVPLYPSCSGLLIERGSLLSHSAVVARELGLPTIVGVSGGLMTKLKTGQKVRMDATKGEIWIL